jgi:hypothetical protein
MGSLTFRKEKQVQGCSATPPFKVFANDLFVGYYVFAALLLSSRPLRFVWLGR